MQGRYENPTGSRFRIVKTEGGGNETMYWVEEWRNYVPKDVLPVPEPKWQWRVIGFPVETYADAYANMKKVVDISRPEVETIINYFDGGGYKVGAHPGDE